MVEKIHTFSTINNLKDYISKAREKIPCTSKIEVECESIEMVKRAMPIWTR